jgi:hypothetical protein
MTNEINLHIIKYEGKEFISKFMQIINIDEDAPYIYINMLKDRQLGCG